MTLGLMLGRKLLEIDAWNKLEYLTEETAKSVHVEPFPVRLDGVVIAQTYTIRLNVSQLLRR